MNEPQYVPWPDGKRVAVMLDLILEAWQAPPPVSTALTPVFPQEARDRGLTDHALASWQTYGVKTGFSRLMGVLQRNDCVATVSVSGLVAERHPHLLEEFVRNGNEVNGHGYSQDKRMYYLDPEEEAAEIRLCADLLEQASGMRPVGWLSQGAQSGDTTAENLLDAGFFYHADYRDRDRPYVLNRREGRTMIAMPGGDVNDVPLFRNGHTVDAYVRMFCRNLDQLRSEGADRPQMMTAVAHSTHLGRPFGAQGLDECLKYALSFEDVWVCRRRDAAEWYLKAVNGD